MSVVWKEKSTELILTLLLKCVLNILFRATEVKWSKKTISLAGNCSDISEKNPLWCNPKLLRLMSWCMILWECKYSRPRRTCWETQMISNSLIGPQLSSFSRTEPPSPASMNKCTVCSHSNAPYSSAMFSWRNRAWISTSAGLKCSMGIWRESTPNLYISDILEVYQKWACSLYLYA